MGFAKTEEHRADVQFAKAERRIINMKQYDYLVCRSRTFWSSICQTGGGCGQESACDR